ncbi:MAG: 3-phosphoserine/phosphohydroxythreonine transaminase [Phycisphaeraceae bacterium]|nr:3-phosphoserine/phosphohydroxythreonine transaminase [Phycisphaeraceae bacterium]
MTTFASASTTMTSASNRPKRIFNFSAGPACMPEEVLAQLQEDIWSVRGSGIGIMEHSHRGPVYDRIIEEAEADCRAVAGIGDAHHVLFLQGGATLQFAMLPLNFLHPGRIADYPDTGVWATKACKEAKLFGKVNVAFDGSKTKYDHTPSANELTLTPDACYLHYCSNNTIYGTRWPEPPKTNAPLVADTSSEMFARPWDFQHHAMVYAGAQKNLGPSGVVLVLLRKDFLETQRKDQPIATMLDYRKHVENGSRLNTPNTLGIHVMGLTFKWILKHGGLKAIEQRNAEKAGVIYAAIDGSGGFYRGHATRECRSHMNVVFRCPSEDLDKKFVKEAEAAGMDGLKGHRDAGGLRASIYNAFPKAGCEALAQFMAEFAKKNG